MGRKKILEKRMQRLMAKKTSLTARALASQDANEVRSINEQLEDVNAEIEETQEEIDAIEEENNGGNPTQTEPTQQNPTQTEPTATEPQFRGINPIATFTQPNGQPQKRAESILDSLEYRNAFASYVRSGDTSGFNGLETRGADDGMVLTTDIGKIIPNTVMNEFIKNLKVYGNLYNKVRKLNVRGGVEFPIQELVPTVKWISEKTVSNTQSAPEINTSIQFGYHICEARIAQSLLSQVVSLAVLESEIAKLLAEAFIKEFDRMILSGTGTGQPLGILNDTRIPKEHQIAFTQAELSDWTKWRKKLFAIVPLAYRGGGVLVMTANTWENYCMTLKNANNDPIGIETYGIQDGATVCRFAGREVILVEPDILADFDTAASGEAWGLYFKPNDYAINSNLQIGFKRYFDDDNNQYVNKGLCILDGKMLDVNSCYILKK